MLDIKEVSTEHELQYIIFLPDIMSSRNAFCPEIGPFLLDIAQCPTFISWPDGDLTWWAPRALGSRPPSDATDLLN